jgi:hypothetical protein
MIWLANDFERASTGKLEESCHEAHRHCSAGRLCCHGHGGIAAAYENDNDYSTTNPKAFTETDEARDTGGRSVSCLIFSATAGHHAL